MRSNRSIPHSTVIPELGYPDTGAAVDWLCDRFGFSLRIRIGNHRAQLTIGDGAVVLMELAPGAKPDASHSMLVRIEDAHAHHEHAVRRGVKILRAPADHPYGERQYTAVDLGGHVWTFTQTIADVDPASWGGTVGRL